MIMMCVLVAPVRCESLHLCFPPGVSYFAKVVSCQTDIMASWLGYGVNCDVKAKAISSLFYRLFIY